MARQIEGDRGKVALQQQGVPGVGVLAAAVQEHDFRIAASPAQSADTVWTDCDLDAGHGCGPRRIGSQVGSRFGHEAELGHRLPNDSGPPTISATMTPTVVTPAMIKATAATNG